MNITEWKTAAMAHFKSGNATEGHWNSMAEALLHAFEHDRLDRELDQIIDPNPAPPFYEYFPGGIH